MEGIADVYSQLQLFAVSGEKFCMEEFVNRNKEALQETRILVFADGEEAENARKAGANYVGGEELIPAIQNDGWAEFDIVVGTPKMMPIIGCIHKELGWERGIMPTPRCGTITTDIAGAIEKIRTGEINYHLQSYLHFCREAIQQNASNINSKGCQLIRR